MATLQSIQAQREAIKRKREAARANQIAAAPASTNAGGTSAAPGVAAQPAASAAAASAVHSGVLRAANSVEPSSPEPHTNKVARADAATSVHHANDAVSPTTAAAATAASWQWKTNPGNRSNAAAPQAAQRNAAPPSRPTAAVAAAAATSAAPPIAPPPPMHAPSPASAADAAAAAAVAYIPALNIPTGASRVPQHWRNVDMAHSVQNDLSQNFVTTGQRPQNFVCDNDSAENEELAAGFNALVPDDRYGGDPEFAHFARLKRELVEEWSARTPYMAHRYDLRSAINNERELTSLLGGYEFDVIVVDPPWKEYQDRAVGVQAPRAERAGLATDVWSLQELKRLPIASLAAEPCLLFLWCGSGPHLAEGQQLMSQWGFKQVEDICWLQTNKSNPSRQGYADDMSIFQRTHEHCLMGIRGEHFVMRDRHMQCMPYAERMESGLVQFVHPGVDIDCIVSEAPPVGSTCKPVQLYSLIERYCVGRRRLELFGSEHNIRQGWLTIGSSIDAELDNFDIDRYIAMFEVEPLWEADGSGPKLPLQYVTKQPPSAAAIAAQQQCEQVNRRIGRFDARLSHYIPHSVELERLRPKSPPMRDGGPPPRRPNRPRHMWNRGVTAGIRALQMQMRDEGFWGQIRNDMPHAHPHGGAHAIAAAAGGSVGHTQLPYAPLPHHHHPHSHPHPNAHQHPYPHPHSHQPQPYPQAQQAQQAQHHPHHPPPSSFAPIAPAPPGPSRWPAAVAPAPMRSLSPQPQFF